VEGICYQCKCLLRVCLGQHYLRFTLVLHDIITRSLVLFLFFKTKTCRSM